MGANLARLEIRVILEELLGRLEGFELAGPVERVQDQQACRRVPGADDLPAAEARPSGELTLRQIGDLYSGQEPGPPVAGAGPATGWDPVRSGARSLQDGEGAS